MEISKEDKFSKNFGLTLLLILIWSNGFMLGAAQRIIEGSGKTEFWFYFIGIFIGIFLSILLYKGKFD